MATDHSKKLTFSALALGGAIAAAALNSALLPKRKKNPVAGKVVVVTGGSRGLGLQIAAEFGKAGAKLVLAARHEEELKKGRDLLMAKRVIATHDDVLLIACNLQEDTECQRLIQQATEHFGHVDVLINNAGTIHVGPLEKQPLEAYRESMNSNFFAALQTTYAVIPQMLQRKDGAIVNIASIGGKIPVPHLAPYVASKFAAVGFSETLHTELQSKGIRVTTVCPGLLRTGSYPNAIVVGDLEKEYRWFSLGASLPGIAHGTTSAARKILQAVVKGRAEITIGLDAYLAARLAGIAPETTQALGQAANSLLLPKTSGTNKPTTAQNVKAIQFRPWRILSDWLTRTQNEPAA